MAPRVFFPDSPTVVGSPVDDGTTFRRRRVRQKFIRRMCRLVLPMPAPLMQFEGDSAAPRIGASDSASLEGTDGSPTHNTVTTATATPATSNRGSASSGTSVAASAACADFSVKGSSLPQNLRIGLSPCDPLLAFEKFAFVATSDGRVAVYSLVNYSPLISEDVLASERRRLDEWAEEDHLLESILPEADANVNGPWKEGSGQDEQDLKSRLRKHEDSLRVEAMMVISLSNIADEPNGLVPPTIVALGAADCLIERSTVASTASEAMGERSPSSASSLVPNLTEDLVGHVAILDESGSIHIVELVMARSGTKVGNKHASSMESKVVFSFHTGQMGATCLSIQQDQANGEKHLVVGYCSGEVASYQIFTACARETEIKSDDAKSQEHLSPSPHKRSTSTVPVSPENAAIRTESLEQADNYRESALGPISAKIVWRGCLPVPVRASSTSRRSTLLFLGTEQLQRNGYKTTSYTATCRTLSPSVSIEVVDTSLVKKIWDKTGAVVDLSCCSIWPAAGKEMKDGWTRNPDFAGSSGLYDKLDLITTSVTDRMCCKDLAFNCIVISLVLKVISPSLSLF